MPFERIRFAVTSVEIVVAWFMFDLCSYSYTTNKKALGMSQRIDVDSSTTFYSLSLISVSKINILNLLCICWPLCVRPLPKNLLLVYVHVDHYVYVLYPTKFVLVPVCANHYGYIICQCLVLVYVHAYHYVHILCQYLLLVYEQFK